MNPITRGKLSERGSEGTKAKCQGKLSKRGSEAVHASHPGDVTVVKVAGGIELEGGSRVPVTLEPKGLRKTRGVSNLQNTQKLGRMLTNEGEGDACMGVGQTLT